MSPQPPAPAVTVDHNPSPSTTPAAVDDEFVLDMRVMERIVPGLLGSCDTSDGCGSTCSTTACSTGSLDPS